MALPFASTPPAVPTPHTFFVRTAHSSEPHHCIIICIFICLPSLILSGCGPRVSIRVSSLRSHDINADLRQPLISCTDPCWPYHDCAEGLSTTTTIATLLLETCPFSAGHLIYWAFYHIKTLFDNGFKRRETTRPGGPHSRGMGTGIHVWRFDHNGRHCHFEYAPTCITSQADLD